MRIFLFLSFGFLLSIASLVSCKKDKTQISIITDECPDTISFTTQVEPWVTINCSTSGCHDAGSAANGLNLEGHSNVAANATDILHVIRHDAGYTPMPLGGGQIADSLITQFDCWIKQGLQDN